MNCNGHTGMLKATVQQMQEITNKLGIPLHVCWTPKDCDKHGELCEDQLVIYDKTESEAWATFQHELFEHKFKEVVRGYRLIINSLIECVEKMTYTKKEEFLEFNLRLADAMKTSEVKTLATTVNCARADVKGSEVGS